MGTFRIHKSKDYTVMSNYHLRDKRLSLKAKGLLSQMFSLPDDWHYSIRGLAAINKGGVRTIQSALVEMEECGYLVRSQSRSPDGRGFGNMVYDIFETPQTYESAENAEITPLDVCVQNVDAQTEDVQNVHTQNEHTRNPRAENVYTQNQPQLITNNINYLNTKKESKKERAQAPSGGSTSKRKSYDEIIDEMIGDDAVRTLMREFVRTRINKSQGKYLTNKQLTQIIKRLLSLEPTDVDRQIAVISRSLRKGWADLYELPEGEWKHNISEATRETVLSIKENSDITMDTPRLQEKFRHYEELAKEVPKEKSPLESYKGFPQNEYDFDNLEQMIVQN